MVRAMGAHTAWETGDKALRNDSALNSRGTGCPYAVPAGIRRIVIPLDGSRSAEHAVPYAIAIARQSGASIVLVHVFSLLESVGPWEQSYYTGVADHYRRQKHRYLNALVHRVRASLGGTVTNVVMDDLDVAGAISRMTDASTLVIMATRSRSLIKKLFMGSVADALIRKLQGPLLLVRGSNSPPDLSSDPLPRHILIPLDGTECAEKVIPHSVHLGRLGDARYSLVHLRDAGRLVSRAEISAAEEYLKDLARRSASRTANVEVEALVSERGIATDLLEFADKNGADWIAVTVHSRPLLARLFHRSVAHSVVRRASMPILIVRHPLVQCEQVLVESLWT